MLVTVTVLSVVCCDTRSHLLLASAGAIPRVIIPATETYKNNYFLLIYSVKQSPAKDTREQFHKK